MAATRDEAMEAIRQCRSMARQAQEAVYDLQADLSPFALSSLDDADIAGTDLLQALSEVEEEIASRYNNAYSDSDDVRI